MLIFCIQTTTDHQKLKEDSNGFYIGISVQLHRGIWNAPINRGDNPNQASPQQCWLLFVLQLQHHVTNIQQHFKVYFHKISVISITTYQLDGYMFIIIQILSQKKDKKKSDRPNYYYEFENAIFLKIAIRVTTVFSWEYIPIHQWVVLSSGGHNTEQKCL